MEIAFPALFEQHVRILGLKNWTGCCKRERQCVAIFGVVLDVSLIAVLVSGLVALNLKYRNSNV